MTIWPFKKRPGVGVCFIAAPWHWSLGYVTIRTRGLVLRALCFGPVELQHWSLRK